MTNTQHSNSFRKHAGITCICGVSIALFAFSSSNASAAFIDGNVSAGEYSNVADLYFGDQQSGVMVPEPGQLYWSVDANTGNVSAAFVMPLSLNDNTYGTGAIGWGTKGHTFGNLTGSDKGQFDFTDSTGKLVLSFNVDYLTSVGGKGSTVFDSLGVKGGDGGMLLGSTASVISASTSLDYNLNVLGYSSFIVNSPTTTAQLIPGTTKVDYSKPYADPASAPGWVYDVIYEVEVSGSVFGAAGFGGVNFPSAHNSPSKLGISTFPQVPPPTPVPEPGTAVPLAALLAALAFSRRSAQVVQS